MPTVRLPAAFMNYACQRTLVCCHEPTRAPCEPDEQERIKTVLASTAEGRGYIPIFAASTEAFLSTHVFKHEDGHCQNLRIAGEKGASESGCSLHFLGGVDALSTACRNYPRWVSRVAVEPGSDVQVEAMFLVSCPTAAQMLVRNPQPFRFVEVPLDSWIYKSTGEATIEATARAQMLREGWWRLLAEERHNTERLAALLNAMLRNPLAPPDALPDEAGPLEPQLMMGIRSLDIGQILSVLERIPERGANYAVHYWEVRHDTTQKVERDQIMGALDIAPELLAAFLDHLIPFAGLHDERPTFHWMKTCVRRTIAIARLADSLLTRVPFGIDTLFADLFVGSMQLDGMLTRADD